LSKVGEGEEVAGGGEEVVGEAMVGIGMEGRTDLCVGGDKIRFSECRCKKRQPSRSNEPRNEIKDCASFVDK
jgi:hypothetical protein